jgi:hypothetical protein
MIQRPAANRRPFFSMHIARAALLLTVSSLTAPSVRASSVLQVDAISGSTIVAGSGMTLQQIATDTSANTSTLSTIQATANAALNVASSAVPSSRVGVSGGVAGLNTSGKVTAPISTSNVDASSGATFGWNNALTWTTSSGTGTQYANPKVSLGQPWQMGVTSSGTAVSDDYMPPWSMRLGGSQEYDGVPLFVHNIPYGPANMGIVDGVFMQSQNMRGSEAGIGPDGQNTIANYDNFDAVARYTMAGPATPQIIATATSDFTQPDGMDHTPTFTASGATFSNPLPQPWSEWIIQHPHAHMMTNEIGSSSAKINTYVGQLTGYTLDANGLVKGITTDGWRIMTSGNTSSGQIPGTTTVDGSTPALDSVWSSFSHPALMMGLYTKAFGQNIICHLTGAEPNYAPGDINYPTGNTLNQVHSCTAEEIDLWNDGKGPIDYLQGPSIVYAGPRPGASSDSFDIALSGGNETMMKVQGEWWSDVIDSRGLTVSGYAGPDYAAGSTKVVADFESSNRPGWDADSAMPTYSHNLQFMIWHKRNQDDSTTSNQNKTSDITTNIGMLLDDRITSGKVSINSESNVQEHIELNPSAYPNGIGLCGYNDCGFYVDSNSHPVATQDTTIAAGKSLYFSDSNATMRGSLYAGTDGALHLNSASGSTGTISVDGHMTISAPVTYSAHSYSSLSSSGLAAGSQSWCSDCYSSSNTASTRGIPVWWNGSSWTDALGQNVKH